MQRVDNEIKMKQKDDLMWEAANHYEWGLVPSQSQLRKSGQREKDWTPTV